MRQIFVGQPEDQTRLVCRCSIPLLRWGMFSLLMMIGQTITGNLTTAHAQSASANQPHLYFFTSDGCAPCEVVKPSIARLAAAGYPTTTIHVRKQPKWAQHFKISRTPTVVLVQNDRAVGRREGMIRHDELLDWFKTINYQPPTEALLGRSNLAHPKPASKAVGTKVVLDDQRTLGDRGTNNSLSDDTFDSPTMLDGTTQPSNRAESRAMAATVKLQVEDPEGISYATGTVIHTHKNESLVMTCGHVFRDSEGTGVIQAHYGFDQSTQRSGPGELIFYDADARDIALIVIKTEGRPLPTVEVASRSTIVSKGDSAFSIGCDNGESPTIRHTQIKNRAAYDGAIKYDIFGRPVNGRSGGGLFTPSGQIVGVCNAAVVDYDEGIYTALDTIHWQLAKVKLDHLFDPATALAMASPSPLTPKRDTFTQPSSVPKPPSQFEPPSQFQPLPKSKPLPEDRPTEQLELSPREPPRSDLASGPQFPPARDRSADSGNITQVSLESSPASKRSTSAVVDYDHEVLIIVRSKDDWAPAKTITIDNPSHQLMDYLEKLTPQQRTERSFNLARFREEAESGVRRPFQSSVRR